MGCQRSRAKLERIPRRAILSSDLSRRQRQRVERRLADEEHAEGFIESEG
jgi:hypothetical protein